jgi:hypothetical protein
MVRRWRTTYFSVEGRTLMNHWMGFSRTAVAAAVAVVAAAPALAQNTTSSVSGRVLGADGKPVAGATVTLVHVQSGSTNTVTSNSEGLYVARGLRAGGPYTITVSKAGQTDKREDVFLALAETLNLDASLGSQATTVVVTGRGASDKFNPNSMGAGTNIGSRELGALASIQRSLQDYARTDPRLAQTDKENSSISVAGQNSKYNAITIDGVNISDTFGLELNNLPTKKQPISIDAIQSVQVNISNYDVTQKGYTGANINAVTKSGTNEFHGSLYYIWRDDNLVGKFFNRTTQTYNDFPSFKEDTKGFTLGGPIIPDKLFFFGSYEQFKSTKATPAFGPVGSPRTNVGITQANIDTAISTARNTWGMDVGTSEVPTSLALEVKDTLFKLDWNISDNHRANIRYSKTQQTEPITTNTNMFGAGQLSLSSYWYVTDKTIETVVGQWFADWTPEFSTELKVSQRDYTQRHTPVNGTRLPAVRVAFGGPAIPGTASGNRNLDFGTEQSRQFNVLDTKTTDLFLSGNLAMGMHEFKFGADYNNNDIFNAFLQNVNGSYTFQCENSSSTITYSFGSVTCGTANTASPAALQAQAALENFQRGRPSSYTVQLPRAGRTLQDGAASFSIANTGLFLQDTWKVNKNLSLMYGVRLDQQKVPDKPILNVAATAAPVRGTVTGSGDTAQYTRATGGMGIDNSVTLDGNTLAQPRIGFNWNPGLERRSQLRGGIGLFQGAAATVWLSNPFSNTGAATVQFNCASLSACATANAQFNPNPDTQPSLTGVPPAAAIDAISPSMEQPSVWKANLAFEHEMPALPVVGTLVAGVEWLHTRTNTAIFLQNLNLGAPTRLGPDGREIYFRNEALEPGCWTASTGGSAINSTTDNRATPGGKDCRTPSGQSRTRALSNASFANVILASKTKKGVGNALTFSLTKPVTDGLGWGVSYTKTAATEVSPLTSSTSNSTWNTRAVFNPNEEVAGNSNYTIRDRFAANLTWSKAFISTYKTTVGVFFEGRRGRPYSWTYINDLNGDAITGNDLMYVPSAPGSGEVKFNTPADETAFWAVVDANPDLGRFKGRVVDRNSSYAPWVNNVDMRISQELPGFTSKHKAVFALDFLNFGNLLNKKWGRIDEVAFPSRRSFVNFVGIDPGTGKYIYSVNTNGAAADLTTKQVERESQWAIQATLRYEF